MLAWDAFVACGGGLVDTADDYGAGLSEELIGAGLRRSASNVHVATKGSSQPSQLVAAAKSSCKRLGVECVTLYQLHSVIEPLEAAADALAQIAIQGLARCVGACNHSLAQLERLRKRLATKGVRLASCQVHASLLVQSPFVRAKSQPPQPSLHEWCQAHGVALIAYAPLASGRLARGVVEESGNKGGSVGSRAVKPAFRLVPPLIAPGKRGFGSGIDVARLMPLLRVLKRGGDGVPAHTALGWLIAHENVLAIPGCKTAAQVSENLGALCGDAADLTLEMRDQIGAAGRVAAAR